MSTISIVGSAFVEKEPGFFSQIMMFSVSGLAMSLVLVIECGLRVHPWF